MLFGAMNFPVHPVMEEFEAICSLGFDYMELAMDPPMAHYSIIWNLRKELEAALKKNGMGLVCHLPTFVFTADLTESIRKASLEEILNSLETAAKLGAQKAVLHPSITMGMGGLVPEKTRNYALDSLGTIVKKAEQWGIRLCFENMFPGYGSFFEPEHFHGVLDKFPSLFMTLDIGHAHIRDTGGDKACRFFEQFSVRIDHLHISDNRGKHDDHLELGKGNLPIDDFISLISGKGYDNTVTFEIFSENKNDIKTSRDTFCRLLGREGDNLAY